MIYTYIGRIESKKTTTQVAVNTLGVLDQIFGWGFLWKIHSISSQCERTLRPDSHSVFFHLHFDAQNLRFTHQNACKKIQIKCLMGLNICLYGYTHHTDKLVFFFSCHIMCYARCKGTGLQAHSLHAEYAWTMCGKCVERWDTD